jgi:beta-glucanase (GH16 family)
MKRSLLLAIAAVFFSVSVHAQSKSKENWKLVWSDEFNYTGLPDSTKWGYDVGGDGWGNQELEYYTQAHQENARVENGNLIVEARKESMGKNMYTSARLVTRGKGDWKYAKVVVRAKVPKGRGTWPAIWMLASTKPYNWPDDGEIDIMEHVGFDPGQIHASTHCKKYYHLIGTQKTAVTPVPDFGDAYHDYWVIYTPEEIRMGVDKLEYFHITNEHSGYEAWPFDNPFHLILNIAVGGGWGGQKGVDETIWPVRMNVDWVHVYQKDDK